MTPPLSSVLLPSSWCWLCCRWAALKLAGWQPAAGAVGFLGRRYPTHINSNCFSSLFWGPRKTTSLFGLCLGYQNQLVARWGGGVMLTDLHQSGSTPGPRGGTSPSQIARGTHHGGSSTLPHCFFSHSLNPFYLLHFSSNETPTQFFLIYFACYKNNTC